MRHGGVEPCRSMFLRGGFGIEISGFRFLSDLVLRICCSKNTPLALAI